MLHHSVRTRLERIHDPVAGGEEDQGTAIHGGQRGRRPGAVEDVRGDVLVVAGHEAAGALVEHDQARRVGRADAPVGVVHAGAAVEVEVIAVNEDGAVGGVVRPDAGAGGQVELPNRLRAGRGCRGVRCGLPGHRRRLEAQDLAAVVDEIDAVALDRDGGGDAAVGPVEVDVLVALGEDELPEEAAGLFVEAHQHAAVALLGGIARVAVVGADVNAAPGDDGRGMGFGAELSGPLDVPAALGIEGLGQPLLRRDHVARPGLAPLRLVGGVGRRSTKSPGRGRSTAESTAGFGSSVTREQGSRSGEQGQEYPALSAKCPFASTCGTDGGAAPVRPGRCPPCSGRGWICPAGGG